MILAKKLLLVSRVKPVVKGAVEFVSSTPMTITPKYTNSGVTLQYSLDSINWTTIAAGTTTPSANVIYFRGSATGTKALFTGSTSSNAWSFNGATNLAVYGKFDRLIQDSLGDDEDILSIGNYCFSNMFFSSTALVYVDEDCLPATTLANYCYANMFYYCTSLTTVPSLPATTLANYCYSSMFVVCISLTTLPKLNALVLKERCYDSMFYFCTKIKISTTMSGIYDTAYRIPTVGTGTTATNALTNMFSNTGGTFTGTPTIDTTYYTENTPV